MLVSAATVGFGFFLFAVPFAGVLAAWFSIAQMTSLDRQTWKLRKNRARLDRKKRDRDGFNVN
jgi:hypothetical protein